MPAEFSTRIFEREHGRKPSRTAVGTWAFSDRPGASGGDPDVLFVNMSTLSEAKRVARAHFGSGAYIYILP